MILHNLTSIASLTALLLAGSMSAQTVARSVSHNRSYGDSDAGVVVGAIGSFRASRTSTVRNLFGEYRHDTLAAKATGYVYANLRFLGSYRQAGVFSTGLNAQADIFRTMSGRYINSTCKSNGTAFLKVGNSILWNRALPKLFGASANLQVRISAPTLYVPMPDGGIMRVRGRAYGRVHGFVTSHLDPCKAKVTFNGHLSVSGHGTVSVSAYSLIFNASVSAAFWAADQKLEASILQVQPAISSGANWGKLGNLRLRSGAMRGYIRLKAWLPPIIPVSFTIANWSKSATTKTLL